MPELSVRYEKTLDFHKGEVLNWVTMASSEHKLAFLESYLLSFTLKELEKCFSLLQKFFEKNTENQVLKVKNPSPQSTTPRRLNKSECFKAKVVCDLESAKFGKGKPLDELEVAGHKFKQPNIGSSFSNTTKSTTYEEEDIKEFIKSSVGASWLVEENPEELSSPIAKDVCPEGFEVLLAFRIDDSHDKCRNLDTALEDKSSVVTKKRKRKGKNKNVQDLHSTDHSSNTVDCNNAISTAIGSQNQVKICPNLVNKVNQETRSPLQQLQSPPAKRLRQVSKNPNRFPIPKLGATSLPVHWGLLKVKMEKDYVPPSCTKAEPHDSL